MENKHNKIIDAFGGALRKENRSEFTVVGIPFDEKSSNRKGAAGGPDAIRAASSVRSVNSFTESNVDLSVDTTIADAGNIYVIRPDEKYFLLIEKTVAGIAQYGSIPVVLGGDHSITYPVVRGIKNVYDRINIVWFDSHPDFYHEYEGDRYSHACPLSRIYEIGGIDSIILGGIRASTRSLNERLKNAGISVFSINEIDKMHNLKLPGKTYLSIDIDVLDPAFAPGVGNPVPGGISTRDLINLLCSLDLDIIGFDLVEVNQEYDHANITAAAGAKIVMEMIGYITAKRKQ